MQKLLTTRLNNPFDMKDISTKITEMENLLSAIAENLKETKNSIKTGFEKIDQNFDIIHTRIDSLSGFTNKGFEENSKNFKDVEFKLLNIKEEITNIGKVVGFEEQIANLRIVNGDKS